jgi:TolB protein
MHGALRMFAAKPARPGVWNLWLHDLATGETRRLTRYAYGQTWGASWFADGVRLCYTHEDTLSVLDLQSGTRREYSSPIRGRLVRTPAVSPDGNRVVFQVYRSGVWLLDTRSGTMQPLLADRSAEEFDWSPDGSRIAFHSKRDGMWGIWTLELPR